MIFRSVPISGEIASFEIVLHNKVTVTEPGNLILAHALDREPEVRRELQDQILASLGPNFELRNFSIAPDEARFTLSLVALERNAISVRRYKTLVRTVNLLANQLGLALVRFFVRTLPIQAVLDFESSWTPGSGLPPDPSVTAVLEGQTSRVAHLNVGTGPR